MSHFLLRIAQDENWTADSTTPVQDSLKFAAALPHNRRMHKGDIGGYLKATRFEHTF